VLRFLCVVAIFLSAAVHADPPRPTHFTQFANAMVAWEKLINRARKPYPADLPDEEYRLNFAIGNEEAVHVAHLLNPLLISAEETYAVGLYVLSGEGIESGLVRQLLRKALHHLSDHPNNEYVLFYLTGMGGILREWGLLDEQMHVVPRELKFPLSTETAASTLTCVEKILERRRE
jgi:hypothetical protein